MKSMFESQKQWDTDISSVGGAKDFVGVISPYSDHPSANAQQGTLTAGNLLQEFDPPTIDVSPVENGYYIHNRLNVHDTNPCIETGPVTQKMPSRKHKRVHEAYTEMPEFVGSNIHVEEGFTNEEAINIVIIIMSIISFCIIGVCFGFLIPKFKVVRGTMNDEFIA